MFRTISYQPDGRIMYKVEDGWAFCTKEKAITMGWQDSPNNPEPPFKRTRPMSEKRRKALLEAGFILND